MNRPALKVGDVVKLSKKGRVHPRMFPRDSTLVVSHVRGDGIDRTSVVTCRIEVNGVFKQVQFYRSELWSTGANAFDGSIAARQNGIPEENDERGTCYICGEATYRNGKYAICKNADCEWYRK